MRKSFNDVLNKIQRTFLRSFGQTPLRQRNEDILKEAIELSRFTSIANLKEEHGDLLCSLLMSFKENGWDPVECIEASLSKINHRSKQYQAYGRKLNVAILGGAFDPIHSGHVAVAEFILNCSYEFDQVWIMPCYKHLYGKQMTAPKHRFEMCKLAVAHDRRIRVSDYEIKHKLGGETYHLTKRLLSEDFAKHKFDFSFVIGMDNANSFDKWQNFRDLEKMIRFIVVPRTGVEIKHRTNWYLQPPHMFIVPEKPLPNVSSTYIRRSLSLRQTGVRYPTMTRLCDFEPTATNYIRDNINDNVVKYIQKHNLYLNME